MTATPSPAVLAAIQQAAQREGVPLNLALAIAAVESGYNPNAIGDNGHSVGLYQLNDAGEGAGMTVAQRENPLANALTALSRVGAVLRTQPNIDPGQAAALAQRPANPGGYAARVNAILGTNSAGGLTSEQIAAAVNGLGSAVGAGISSGSSSSGGAAADAASHFTGIFHGGLSAFRSGFDASQGTATAGDAFKKYAIALAVGVVVIVALMGRDFNDGPKGGGAVATAAKAAPLAAAAAL